MYLVGSMTDSVLHTFIPIHALLNPTICSQQVANRFLVCVPATRAAIADNTAYIKSSLFQNVSKIVIICHMSGFLYGS